jgi:hypothetical protein
LELQQELVLAKEDSVNKENINANRQVVTVVTHSEQVRTVVTIASHRVQAGFEKLEDVEGLKSNLELRAAHLHGERNQTRTGLLSSSKTVNKRGMCGDQSLLHSQCIVPVIVVDLPCCVSAQSEWQGIQRRST